MCLGACSYLGAQKLGGEGATARLEDISGFDFWVGIDRLGPMSEHVRFGPKADIMAYRHYSIGCNVGAAGAARTLVGAASESGTLSLQTSPVGKKVASTFPPNCARARKNRRVPKP